MKNLGKFICLFLFSTGLIAVAHTVTAAQHQAAGMHAMHGKSQRMCHEHHWQSTLSEEQKTQLAVLKLDYKKKLYPVKASIREARVALALLVTAASPDQNAIDSQIDEIAKLKALKMRLKASHKIAVRKLLNADQRITFDMHMLKKAYAGKQGQHGHGYHHGGH